MEIGFIGFGLIGGSIARVLKTKKDDITIHVYTRRQNPDLLVGVEEGVIDELHYDFSEWISKCHIIFLCAPVLTNIRLLKEIKPLISDTAIITDVGSVKGNIYQAAAELNMANQFIGGHPMAGSEKTGYLSSTTTLLENAYYLLTPSEESKKEDLEELIELVNLTGAMCVVLSPKEHDMITAAISHVPHIIAATLVNMVRVSDDKKERMKLFAAGGFRDITRIASSSPEMWESICSSNTESIHKFIQKFQSILQDFDDILLSGNQEEIRNTFIYARDYRDALPDKKAGPLVRQYELFIDVEDKAGAIARVATLLANHQINIKNIGILHSRDAQEGALHIEFDDEETRTNAIDVLTRHHLRVIENQ